MTKDSIEHRRACDNEKYNGIMTRMTKNEMDVVKMMTMIGDMVSLSVR